MHKSKPIEYRLLEKTELWVKPVRMSGVDLDACARATAAALGLKIDEVMVTDAIGDTLTLDILVATLAPDRIVGRKKILLSALKEVSGLEITDDTDVHSDGVLGLISLDEETGRTVLQRTKEIAEEVFSRIRKRAMVCSTGQEVLAGQIRDTNTPFLLEALRNEGYVAVRGPVLPDDANGIARAFRDAASGGMGLLVTSGGIGAESKDQTLEALKRVDPEASTPYLLKFRQGHGRHQKDGVRIGVGYYEPTLIVCLPGPNDEVRLAWPVLRKGIREGWGKELLAEAVADALRRKFLKKSSPARHELDHDRRGHGNQ